MGTLIAWFITVLQIRYAVKPVTFDLLVH